LNYRGRLSVDLEKALQRLMFTADPVLVRLVDPAIHSGLEFLRKHPGLFDERVAAGKIVQCHGDLRPEHICLEPTPVVIDCLELNRSLRTLDIASELSFLALECERLGAPEIGNALLRTYSEITGDSPSLELLAFYRTYHACIRAQLAVSHLNEHTVERRKWLDKAEQYLQMATIFERAA
jgi:aminoglycoside phosphotransferase family enzyme